MPRANRRRSALQRLFLPGNKYKNARVNAAAPPHLHALRLRFLAARLRAKLCKLSTRRIKARSTTRASCLANNLAIQRSCSSLTLLVGRQGLARRAQLNFVLTFYRESKLRTAAMA
jgi:hypothetical protein